MSLEHALRDLWQQVLWDGWALGDTADGLRQGPVDRQLAVLWAVWYARHLKILGQGSSLDAIAQRAADLAGQLPEPFLKQTALGIGGASRETRRFRFGQVSGRQFGQSWHRTEYKVLEDSYLAQFLDAPLPKLANNLTCRDLQVAWCVLRDCASVLNERVTRRSLDSFDAVEACALLIRRDEIVRAIQVCAELDSERAEKVVQFFTCQLDNFGSLFARGLWSTPLVSLDGNKNLAVCLAALSVGSAVRRIESWLDRGELSDHLTDARRGERYEAWVRKEISAAIADNEYLPDAKCVLHSIERPGDTGEQIDLLILLGNLVVVGEVKCRLYPVESIERYNYLRRLNEAGDQVVRKGQWLEQNAKIIADAFQISIERARSLHLVPIVVLNQGAGFGILANGARVVDFHFLKLLMADNEYLAGMVFDMTKQIYIPTHEHLYVDEKDAAARFEDIIANPPPLTNAIASVQWRVNKFPLSDGHHLLVENCYSGEPSEEPARLANFLSSAKRSKKARRMG